MSKMQNDFYKICFLDADGYPSQYLLFVSDRLRQNINIPSFFSNVEWEMIQEKNIEANIRVCSNYQIHSDDSIQTIKRKIMREESNIENMEDMYLFAVVEKEFSPLKIYKRLSQLDSVPITQYKLNQFLANYFGIGNGAETVFETPIYRSKNEYVYEDLLELDWFYGRDTISPKKTKKIPLGKRFVVKPHDNRSTNVILNQDLFATSPFDILFPNVYKPSINVSLETFELDFLFHYGSILENTIYVCLKNDVEVFLQNQSKSNVATDSIIEDTLQLYFPYAGNPNKISVKKEDSFWEEQHLTDIIRNIPLHDNSSGIEYKQHGIYSFHFIIHPDFPNQLPLETIFKNVHASMQIPMIQYHPGLRREKIYRLFYHDIAQNGHKIPLLNKSVLFKLMEKPGKNANVSMFLWTNAEMKTPNFMQVAFESNGDIHVTGELDQSISYERFNEWMRIMISPAIQEMNSFLSQVGFSIRPFVSLQEESIEIVELKYKCIVNVPKKVEWDKIMGLFSPFFYNELGGESSNTTQQKRYKRIEYFQRMNPHEEYISELLRITQNKRTIQTELWKKFKNESDAVSKEYVLTMETAKEVMDKYEDKHRATILPSKFINKNIEILEHTGFPTVFNKTVFDNEWSVDIREIYRFEYIPLLHSYLQQLFIVSQDISVVPSEIYNKYRKRKLQNASDVNTFDILPIVRPEPVLELPIFVEDSGKVENNNIVAVPVEDTSSFELPEEENEDVFELMEEYEDEDEEFEMEDSNKKNNIGGNGEKGGNGEEETNGKKERKGKKGKKNDKDNDSDIENEDMNEISGPKNLDNYFIKRIKYRNPLIYKSGFARICPANDKRHPIILTEKEKQRIDQEYPDPENKPYQSELKYGVDKENNPLYYICPNYWCVKPGQEGPLTEEDVKNKKCGEIIKDPNNIRPGEYTYKWREGFNDPGVVNRKVKHDKITIIDPRTGKEICYPCCFQTWHGKPQNELRFKEQCLPESEAQFDKKQQKLLEKKQAALKNEEIKPTAARNVLGMTKFPLETGRIGLLPIQIQMFLNLSNATQCVDFNNRPKLNCPLLIRYGAVQPKYNNQYFLGILADLYAYQRSQTKMISISGIREILCNAISIDKFVQLHNASLVSIFRHTTDDFLSEEYSTTINLDLYKNTELYKRLDLDSDTHLDFFKSTVISYEHFLQYLRDESVVIDHTFLWEAVSEKNPLLLPNGINMAILEIMNQDITNNVELLCPTAAYQSKLYDPNKETLIVVKQNEVYEPIYLYEITSLNPEIISYTKTFSNAKEVAGIQIILKMIQSWILQQCAPTKISDIKNKYTFERNISAEKIIYLLKDIGGYIIRSQVLNYQNKIIGFMVEKKNMGKINNNGNKVKTMFYLPTFPSPIISNVPSKWMDEPDLWLDYETTISLLKELYEKSKSKIMCKPLFRILEDEKVVGILTMTNQFIQIMPYEDNREFKDGLQTLDESNYFAADIALFSNNLAKKIDVDRPKSITKEFGKFMTESGNNLSEKQKMVQHIKLETLFYNSFRNSTRIVLNLYKSRKIRDNLKQIIFDDKMEYHDKLENSIRELKILTKDLFVFQTYDDAVLQKIQDIFLCKSDGSCKTQSYCLFKKNENDTTNETVESCQLILPEKHLVNGEDNSKIYYGRLADEMVRHKRIRLFMMQPDSYLHLSSDEYKLIDNEFIAPKSILTKEYFDELAPYTLKKYARTTVFENANPSEPIANPTLSWKENYDIHKNK